MLSAPKTFSAPGLKIPQDEASIPSKLSARSATESDDLKVSRTASNAVSQAVSSTKLPGQLDRPVVAAGSSMSTGSHRGTVSRPEARGLPSTAGGIGGSPHISHGTSSSKHDAAAASSNSYLLPASHLLEMEGEPRPTSRDNADFFPPEVPSSERVRPNPGRRERQGEERKRLSSFLTEEFDALLKTVEDQAEVPSIILASPTAPRSADINQLQEATSAATQEACDTCGKVFQGGDTIYENDKDAKRRMLCERCWNAELPTCSGCKKIVAGRLAKIGDNVYHPECLICSVCATTLSGSFSQTSTGFTCPDCCS